MFKYNIFEVNMIRIIIMSILLNILLIGSLSAQNLKIFKKDGTFEEHFLNDIVKIEPKNLVFNYNMIINKKEGSAITINFNQVEKLVIENENLLVFIDGSSVAYGINEIENIVFNLIPTNYETVIIGNQEWMLKNLDVTHYRNGDEIPNVTENNQWSSLTTGAWCYYNNEESQGEIYGKLYNWYAVNDSRGLAPIGWRIASEKDWTDLSNYLQTFAGSKIAGYYNLWWAGELRENASFNSSGFTGLANGFRYGSDGYFDLRQALATWWTSTNYNTTNAFYRYLHYNMTGINKQNFNKKYGFAVRCVRDVE